MQDDRIRVLSDSVSSLPGRLPRQTQDFRFKRECLFRNPIDGESQLSLCNLQELVSQDLETL